MTPQEFSNQYQLDAMELDHDRGFIIKANFITNIIPYMDHTNCYASFVDYKQYAAYYGGDISTFHPTSMLGRWHTLNVEADRFKYLWYRYTLTLKRKLYDYK